MGRDITSDSIGHMYFVQDLRLGLPCCSDYRRRDRGDRQACVHFMLCLRKKLSNRSQGGARTHAITDSGVVEYKLSDSKGA